MKRLMMLFCLLLSFGTMAQLPGKVKKLEGLWEYKEGSGFEKWVLNGEVLIGESFRINKLGDTMITERFEIRSVNKRLVLSLKAYNVVGDSLAEKNRSLIGKKRKMEFTSIDGVKLETLTYKPAFLSRKKMFLYIGLTSDEKPRKLVLIRKD